jgi:mRNA-degrading endonuclease RelE of RelBE toxin-antitoxin system
MKSLFLATAFAATMAFALPTVAEAKVIIYLGVPHYSYQVGPDYRFRPGHGWYRPIGIYNRLSCGEAKWRVRNHGYRNVSTIECSGRTYTFRAKRGDNRVIVYVNARNGAIWRG